MSYNPVIAATDPFEALVTVLGGYDDNGRRCGLQRIGSRSLLFISSRRRTPASLASATRLDLFVLQQAEELGEIPDEQHFMTISSSSYTAAGDCRGLAPVNIVGILSEKPTETAGWASVIFSYYRQRNF